MNEIFEESNAALKRCLDATDFTDFLHEMICLTQRYLTEINRVTNPVNALVAPAIMAALRIVLTELEAHFPDAVKASKDLSNLPRQVVTMDGAGKERETGARQGLFP